MLKHKWDLSDFKTILFPRSQEALLKISRFNLSILRIRAPKDLGYLIREAEKPNLSLFFCPSPPPDLDSRKEHGNENGTVHKELARMLAGKDSGSQVA